MSSCYVTVYNVQLYNMIKEVDLYSAFTVVPHTPGAQVLITQCYLQITLYQPLPRKYSPLVSIHQMAHAQTEVADI